MRVQLVCVGKVRGAIAEPVAEFQRRTERYFTFEAIEVREEPARQESAVERVRMEEGKRLLGRVAFGLDVVALDREGDLWSSERLASFLSDLALHGRPGAAFLIGGAYGLSEEVLSAANHRFSLSACTLTHEIARLLLTEQLYRAGTIARGEPYHKTR
jgi:23S rRNA (pseudouridine1915-N3)-methyltransferase